MSSQRFCLRWNNHQSNLLSVFDQLLHDESFVDVTLAVEGQLLKAHKMILSACSPYFQTLFVGHPDKHPIVILKDVPYADMRSLLDFMYRGEVSVDQDRLTAFLKVAESLRIKGLTEVNEERCDIPSIASSLLQSPTPSSSSTHPNPPPHLHRIHHPSSSHKRGLPPMAANPLLGSALTAPKRKRGRPRKLSGGGLDSASTESRGIESRGITSDSNSRGGDSPLLHHATQPELLEVNMGDYGGAESSPPPALPPPEVRTPPRHEDDVEEEEEEAVPPSGDEVADGSNLNSSSAENIVIKEEKIEPMPSTSMNDSTGNFKPGSQEEERFVTPDDTMDEEMEASSPVTPLALCDEITITVDTVTPVTTSTSDEEPCSPVAALFGASGVHFLSHDASLIVPKLEPIDDTEEETSSQGSGLDVGGGLLAKRDLLEYVMQDDGSVICKWCGEWLPSRTHWYRHKYKLHMSNPPSTANLIKCHKCNVFFKSRKGYVGHVSSRHATSSDGNSADETNIPDESKDLGGTGKGYVSKTAVNDSVNCVGLKAARRNFRNSNEELNTSVEAYEKQREKEEKLVADIIDRVKRECEAQGSTVTRRGYSRRTTVMNS